MGDVVDICELQEPIIAFHVNIRTLVLKESDLLRQKSGISPVDKLNSQSPPIDESEKLGIGDWRRSLRCPYLEPVINNLDPYLGLVRTSLEGARDHGSDLGTGEGTKHAFRDREIAEGITAPFEDMLAWDTVDCWLADVLIHGKGTSDSNASVRSLKAFLEGTMLPRLLDQLGEFIKTSPATIQHFRRKTDLTRNTLDQRIESGEEPGMLVPGSIYPITADLTL